MPTLPRNTSALLIGAALLAVLIIVWVRSNSEAPIFGSEVSSSGGTPPNEHISETAPHPPPTDKFATGRLLSGSTSGEPVEITRVGNVDVTRADLGLSATIYRRNGRIELSALHLVQATPRRQVHREGVYGFRYELVTSGGDVLHAGLLESPWATPCEFFGGVSAAERIPLTAFVRLDPRTTRIRFFAVDGESQDQATSQTPEFQLELNP